MTPDLDEAVTGMHYRHRGLADPGTASGGLERRLLKLLPATPDCT